VKERSDAARVERIARALSEAGMDALVCALPVNVLLLSGYWPVVGTSVAVAARGGSVQILAPEDEEDLAKHGHADEVRTFAPGSLFELKSAAEAVREPLRESLKSLGLGRASVIGYESGECFEPASYASVHLYGSAIERMLEEEFSALAPADGLLARLRAALTPHEVSCVRAACRVAEEAFAWGAAETSVGLRETEVAARFREPLFAVGTGSAGAERAGGFAFCMSGPNSAESYAAYQRSRSRELRAGDLALVHCNSYADGYWTDITRTFCLGEPDERKRRMYDAVFAARNAALEVIGPGVRAATVDAAARRVLEARGFGAEFKHGLGHGVGFAAINHNAPPRLHPASDDVLETGMVFNIEPAIYVEGFGGMRHCDMVVLTDAGAEVLTPFQSTVEELTVI
jgi:Xaa-Pro aminopeptidase